MIRKSLAMVSGERKNRNTHGDEVEESISILVAVSRLLTSRTAIIISYATVCSLVYTMCLSLFTSNKDAMSVKPETRRAEPSSD